MGEHGRSDLRVMHVIARMNVGGPAVEICELVRGLGSSGLDQYVLTGACYDGERDYLEATAPDIPVTRVRGLGAGGARMAPFALTGLAGAIRSLQPDIVHTHTAKAGALGRQAARLAGHRGAVVHTFHGHVLDGYFGPRATAAIVRAERTLAKRTDALVCVGNKVRDDLLAAGIGQPSQYRVIRSAIPPIQQVPRSQARAELGIASDALVFLWLGRLVRIKRPDRFLAACETVAEAVPEAVFLVAGGGDAAGDLGTHPLIASGRVRLLGWRSDLGTLLGAADALVLTSDSEGTPLSLIEAGTAGVPVVATAVGSVPEIVDDGVSGLLVACDHREVAAAMLRLAREPELRRSLGAAAAASVPARYSREGFLAGHERLYRELALSPARKAPRTLR